MKPGEKLRIAFQGEAGAYSEAALLAFSAIRKLEKPQSVPCASFDEVFQSVEKGNSELGFIAIENSLAGSIHRNYDLLLQHKLSVVGEYYLRVSHCLLGCPGVKLEEIERVISHPQALAQCDGYLRSLGVIIEAAYDTAGSAKIVSERGDCKTAAIASRRAAEIYGLEILADSIEDNPENFTRFLAISPEPDEPGEDAKTSIVFSLKNVPGSLFRGLSVFALRDIDLTKIESRPLQGKRWQYLFYIDFIGSQDEERCRNALNHLQEITSFFKVLGSYPRGV